MAYRGSYNNFVPSSASNSGSYLTQSNMNSVPPPSSLDLPIGQGMAGQALISARDRDKKKEEEYANLMFYGAKTENESRRKRIYDDEYLEKDDSDDEKERGCRQYQRESEGCRITERTVGSGVYEASGKKANEDEEEDELDAFMAGIDAQASKDKAISAQKEKDRLIGKDIDSSKKGIGRADIDEEDMQESYFKFMEEHKDRSTNDEEELEYDEDGNVIWSWKKVIDPLPPIDHTLIKYPDFHKNFYAEHEDIQHLNHVETIRLRDKLGLRVGGFAPPKPVCSFAHFGFDKSLMDAIRKNEYEQPTPIQAQAIPSALIGRDVLGIAKTGSGKTAAYLWPAIVHIMDQSDLKEGEGPIAVVVVPTRELAIQVYQEAKKFCKVYNINTICAYGGGSKWEQSNELKSEGAELVICTPGRMIDLVKIGATNFLRTTFLVFDEADRMFDMGFEAQVRSISDHIRPDRQCLMFSATFKQKVERLARDALRDPVRIVQGEVGEANADVIQTVEVLVNQDAKWTWLTQHLVGFGTIGKVLIFVTKKVNAEDIARRLLARDFQLVLLHGDMLQMERNERLQAFRKKTNIMVATDVAARGLDIPEIRTVINYDIARDVDTHVHRVGRTGRAGNRGWAYTLITDKDTEMAGHLVRNLESVNQQRQGGGTTNPRARLGLGYKPKTRPTSGGGAYLDPLKEQRLPSASNQSVRDTIRAASTASGPATIGPSSRLAVMKNAFKQSFSATFRPSQEESSKLPQQVISDPRPEWKRKIDEINAKLAVQQQTGSTEEVYQKKKSRWQ